MKVTKVYFPDLYILYNVGILKRNKIEKILELIFLLLLLCQKYKIDIFLVVKRISEEILCDNYKKIK